MRFSVQISRAGRRPVGAALALITALLVAACGSSAGTPVDHAKRSAATTVRLREVRATGPLRLVYHHLYALPAPLRDPAYVALGGSRYVLAGGLSSTDVSTSEVDEGGTGSVSQIGTLPVAQHDAQAALLGGRVYVFGGGSFSELSHILSITPGAGTVTQVGALPSASSDSSVASIGSTAYVVGGYDGTNWLSSVLAYRAGASHPTVVGHLPVGLRYAAVAAAGGKLIVIGGTTAPGTASTGVLSFDPATGQTRRIASLSAPICHAEAVTIDGWVYLVGGRGTSDTSQTAAMWAINPTTGQVHSAGTLPVSLSDAALVRVAGGALVIGGLEGSGAVNPNVGILRAG